MDKQRKLQKLAEVSKKGNIGILKYLYELEEKIDQAIPTIESFVERMKGDKGDSPTEQELLDLITPLIPPPAENGKTPSKEDLLAIIKPLIPKVKNGETPSKEDLLQLIKPLIPQIDTDKIIAKCISDIQKGIKLPSVDELLDEMEKRLPKLSEPIRDSLEILQGEERLDKSAVKGLDELLKETNENLNKRLNVIATNKPLSEMIDVNVQGLQTNQSLKWNSREWVPYTPVDDSQDLQSVTDFGSTTTNSITANSFIKSGGTSSQFLKADGSVDSSAYATTSQLHNALTVTDSAEIDFTLTGQDLTASLKAGSIDETKLDTSVNASLDLADSSVQPADLSSYVPYTGATTNVDLGANDLFTLGNVYSPQVDGKPRVIVLSGAGTTSVNDTYTYSASDGLYAGSSFTSNNGGPAIVHPDYTSVVDYATEGLDTSYVYVGDVGYSFGSYSGFTHYYRILKTEFDAGVDNWLITTGSASVPSTVYTLEAIQKYRFDADGLYTTKNILVQGNSIAGGGTITTDALITTGLTSADNKFFFDPDPFPSGAGSRFIWDSTKFALRAGYVSSTQWDSSNIGQYSVAFNRSTRAIAAYSSAFGDNTLASGLSSFATGVSTTASGANSFVAGQSNTASGANSFVAGGSASSATNSNTVAFGYQVNSTALGAISFGRVFTNSVANSFAVGFNQKDFYVKQNEIGIPQDNSKLKFGAAGDGSIYYDGADLNINTREVGTGDLVVSGGSVEGTFKSSDGSAGATGSFTTADSKTVTVKDGIITSIV